MADCDDFRGLDIKSLNEPECRFLLDVVQALALGPATLPDATRNAARSSMDDVLAQLRKLEGHGLVQRKSRMKSGHLVPEYSLSEAGRKVLQPDRAATTGWTTKRGMLGETAMGRRS